MDEFDRSLLPIIEGWAGQTWRLQQESLGKTPYPGRVWCADDFVGLLHLRDRLSMAMVGLGTDPESPSETVRAIDELFRSFTVESSDPNVWVRFSGDDRKAGWWWRRVPAAGPIADEVRSGLPIALRWQAASPGTALEDLPRSQT